MRKPLSTLVLVGPRGHGKTSLALGLVRRSASAAQAPAADDAPLAGEEQLLPLPSSSGVTLRLACAEFETARRRYTLLDPGEPSALRKRIVAGPLADLPPIDGALIVVDPVAGHGPDLAAELNLLMRSGVAGIVVFLNQSAAMEPEYLDLAELELREALSEAGLAGDAAPIVRGSARALLHGEPAGFATAAALYEAIDEHVPITAERPPRLMVARILATEALCRVVHGALAAGEMIDVVGGVAPTRTAQLVSLTAAPEDPGHNLVRCALRGVAPGDLRVGQTLALPGTLAAHGRFEAELWFFTPPAANEWQILVGADFTVGAVARPLADGSHTFEVELSTAVALAPGDGFGVLADDVLIGVGVVTAVRGALRKRRRGALSLAGLALAFVDSLARGDRPDIAAACLYPPDDVLQATIRGFADDVRPFVRSGRILLRLVDDGRRSRQDDEDYQRFRYEDVAGRPLSVTYIGLRGEATAVEYARGRQVFVSADGPMREYPLTDAVVVSTLRFRIRVIQDGRTVDMLPQLRAAKFAARKGTWYLFDFRLPYSWDKF